MNQWTESARTALEVYFSKTRKSLESSGADVNEVIDDLRRHVEQEVAALRLTVVTEQDVKQILARVGGPEPMGQAGSLGDPQLQPPGKPGPTDISSRPGYLLLSLGILLPLGTVIFEFLTGACAGVLFDPMPTLAHALLTLLVPVVSLAVWMAVRKGETRWRRQLGWASGLSMGVSLVYALLFLPMSPFACIGVIFYGIGLLALAPIFSFIAAWRLRWHLGRATGRLPNAWLGMGLGVLALAVVTLPMIITEMGLQLAVSESKVESERGVKWLRVWGEEERMLRACYGRAGRSSGVYSWGKFINPEQARTVYYRVRGRAFNAVPPPKLYAGRGRWNMLEEEFTWDNDQGGDAVAGRVKGLSVVSSRQDGFVDPTGSLAYLEWTMEFKNDSALQREARAQIQLPPGGVVSRLTLWIDGEEREAAFGGRSQVKTAYKAVVTQRRDPVLVTTCGPDRILVQCFPVPPNGGKMKARVGITAPLVLTNAAAGCFSWPAIVERNFSLSEGLHHALWMESPLPLAALGGKLVAEEPKPGAHLLRGELKDRDLSDPATVMRVARPAEALQSWARDQRQEGKLVRQRIQELPVTPPSRLVIVLDGSVSMKPYFDDVADALRALPEGLEFDLLLAQDGVLEFWDQPRKGDAQLYKDAARRLLRHRLAGGHDNLAALVKGWDLAAQGKPGAVLWIHGPQPIIWDSVADLRQRFERHANPPALMEIQAFAGPNRVAEELDGVRSVRSVLRLGSLRSDLERLFRTWDGKSTEWIPLREQVVEAAVGARDGQECSAHLTRLWAAGEVARLARDRKVEDATKAAANYQLVTPVSGAVVLENQAQYAQAGLQPVSADSVPVIPEPSGGLLFLIGIGIFGWKRFRKRNCQWDAPGA
jgi:hypothetical protein